MKQNQIETLMSTLGAKMTDSGQTDHSQGSKKTNTNRQEDEKARSQRTEVKKMNQKFSFITYVSFFLFFLDPFMVVAIKSKNHYNSKMFSYGEKEEPSSRKRITNPMGEKNQIENTSKQGGEEHEENKM